MARRSRTAPLRRLRTHLAVSYRKEGLVFLLGSNCPEAVVGYIGCLRARAPAALFSAGLHHAFLAAQLVSYRPSYIWLPLTRAAEIPGATEVYRIGTYALLRTECPPLPVHEGLALLMTTSGS